MTLMTLIGLIIAAALGWDWVFWILIVVWFLSHIVAIFDDLGQIVSGDWPKKLGAIVDILWQVALIALAIWIYSLG